MKVDRYAIQALSDITGADPDELYKVARYFSEKKPSKHEVSALFPQAIEDAVDLEDYGAAEEQRDNAVNKILRADLANDKVKEAVNLLIRSNEMGGIGGDTLDEALLKIYRLTEIVEDILNE